MINLEFREHFQISSEVEEWLKECERILNEHITIVPDCIGPEYLVNIEIVKEDNSERLFEK